MANREWTLDEKRAAFGPEVAKYRAQLAQLSCRPAQRRDVLLALWGGEDGCCPIALKWSVERNRVAGCSKGRNCKASVCAGRALMPCSGPAVDGRGQPVLIPVPEGGSDSVLFCSAHELHPGQGPRRGSTAGTARARTEFDRREREAAAARKVDKFARMRDGDDSDDMAYDEAGPSNKKGRSSLEASPREDGELALDSDDDALAGLYDDPLDADL